MFVKRNHAGPVAARSDHALARLAARQHGVVSLDQLLELGWSKNAVVERAGSGRLHRVFRGVYAVGHPQIGRHGLLFAATLACGDGAVISHLTAAELWGIWDRRRPVIDVTVRVESGRKIDGIRARRPLPPTEEEITVHEGVPCTTPARTLLDLAGSVGRPSLRKAVEQAAVAGILDVAAVDAAIERGWRRPGRRTLQTVLMDWREIAVAEPVLRSRIEARVLALITAEGLPRPLCNQILRPDDGAPIEIDLLWPDQRLAVELDGRAYHDTEVAFERDRNRDQRLTLAGYRPIRLTWRQVSRHPDRVISTLRRLLRDPD